MARFLQFAQQLSVYRNLVQQHQIDQGLPSTIHRTFLPYLMTFAIDIGVIFTLFQYYKYSIFIHALICAFCALIAVVTALIMVGKYQPSKQSDQTQRHVIIGIVISGCIILEIICGGVSKILQIKSNKCSYQIFILNKIHKILGHLLLLLCKVQVYITLYNLDQNPKLWILLAVDMLLCLVFIVKKAKMNQMQYLSIPSTLSQKSFEIEHVRSLKPFEKDGKYLGVFANYIYEIQSLVKFHPLGHQIIQSIRGRQFDRYLFGSMPTQRLPKVTPHNHSLNSIKLLGEPIAKLDIPTVFEGLQEDMIDVVISEIIQISEKGHMYEVRLLKSNGNGFKCKGYSSIYQIGRYFVLNLDNKVSRLYITASFLAPSNIELLDRIYFKPNSQAIYPISMSCLKSKLEIKDAVNTQRNLQDKNSQQYLPLFIKKYPGGRLSSLLIDQQFTKLKLSTQRGQGLKLYNLTPGKIVIFLGGTGIVPFGDLIDLLFKAILCQIHPQYKQLIISSNQILGTNQLNGFSFRFYLDETAYEDIHPLTRAQLLQITKYPQLIEFNLKIHEKCQDIRLKRSKIKLMNENILDKVRYEIQSEEYNKIMQYWICCSPIINSKIIQIFDQKSIPQDKFVFL